MRRPDFERPLHASSLGEGAPASGSDSASLAAVAAPERSLEAALSGTAPLEAKHAHLALLLSGPESDAWWVACQVMNELCRRELVRLTAEERPGREDALLLGMLVHVARELGRPPTTREFDDVARERDGWRSSSVIAKRFGSWELAQARAGLLDIRKAAMLSRRKRRTGRRLHDWDRRALAEVLRWCARAVHEGAHRYVTVKEFNDWRRDVRVAAAKRGEFVLLPTHLRYYEIFGDWKKACAAAKLTHAHAAASPRPLRRRAST